MVELVAHGRNPTKTLALGHPGQAEGGPREGRENAFQADCSFSEILHYY